MIAMRAYGEEDMIDILLGYVIEDIVKYGIDTFARLDHYVMDIVDLSEMYVDDAQSAPYGYGKGDIKDHFASSVDSAGNETLIRIV